MWEEVEVYLLCFIAQVIFIMIIISFALYDVLGLLPLTIDSRHFLMYVIPFDTVFEM